MPDNFSIYGYDFIFYNNYTDLTVEIKGSIYEGSIVGEVLLNNSFYCNIGCLYYFYGPCDMPAMAETRLDNGVFVLLLGPVEFQTINNNSHLQNIIFHEFGHMEDIKNNIYPERQTDEEKREDAKNGILDKKENYADKYAKGIVGDSFKDTLEWMLNKAINYENEISKEIPEYKNRDKEFLIQSLTLRINNL